jgi:hypothetical protein
MNDTILGKLTKPTGVLLFLEFAKKNTVLSSLLNKSSLIVSFSEGLLNGTYARCN